MLSISQRCCLTKRLRSLALPAVELVAQLSSEFWIVGVRGACRGQSMPEANRQPE